MSIKVKSIDTYAIEDRLRKSKVKEDKEVLHYINRLKEALKRQQDITNLAINKLKYGTSRTTDNGTDNANKIKLGR